MTTDFIASCQEAKKKSGIVCFAVLIAYSSPPTETMFLGVSFYASALHKAGLSIGLGPNPLSD